MARRDRTEERLHELNALAGEGTSARLETELGDALMDRSPLVVARAAKLIASRELGSLIPPLQASFERLLTDPIKRDPGCLGKLAVAEALSQLGDRSLTVFKAGVRHRQLEPSWGPPIDTAANLRATCADALVAAAYPEIRYELTCLLTDPEPAPRLAAVRNLERLGDQSSELLLLLKVETGDKEPDVIAEALAALVRLHEDRYLPLAEQWLTSEDETVAETVALALGPLHSPAVLEMLRRQWDHQILAEDRRRLVLPIALCRQPAAFDLLSEQLTENRALAPDILRALWICFPTAAKRNRLQRLVLDSGDEQLVLAWREALQEDE